MEFSCSTVEDYVPAAQFFFVPLSCYHLNTITAAPCDSAPGHSVLCMDVFFRPPISERKKRKFAINMHEASNHKAFYSTFQGGLHNHAAPAARDLHIDDLELPIQVAPLHILATYSCFGPVAS